MQNTDYNKMDFFEKLGYTFTLFMPSFEAFKVNWVTIVLLWLIPVLFVLPLLIIIFYILFSGDINVINDTYNIDWTASKIIALIVSISAYLFATLLVWPATIATQLASVQKQKISLNQAIKKSTKNIFSLIIANLALAIIAIAPFMLVIPLFFIFIGLLLLPFALVWFVLVLLVSIITPYIIVYENAKPIEAIKKSYQLSKANWQWILSITIVMIAINLVGQILSYIPFVGFVGLLAGIVLLVVYYCMPAYVFIYHINNNELRLKPTKLPSASPLNTIEHHEISKKTNKE